MTMTVKALAPWFGGKRTLAPRIAEELGEHRAYWEPFCGSMAPLLAKPPATMETVNDLHGDLINLARVIRDPKDGPELYRRLRRTWMDEALYDEAAAIVRGADWGTDERSVDRAFYYFVWSWLGRNGMAGIEASKIGKAFAVRYTFNGGHSATRFRGAIESIPAWRQRLRNVTILRRDGFDLIGRIEDAAGTAIYCDPPYLQKGARYAHDFDTEDHAKLAELLHRFKHARVVVSYYDHQRLTQLYPGWTKVRCDMAKALGHQAKRGENDARAPEVLLINGPSRTQQFKGATEGGLF